MAEEDIYLEHLRKEWEEKYPEAIAAIHEFDKKMIARHLESQGRQKDFYLTKVQSKKHGFTYYVRLRDKGKILPSKWSTKTNDLQKAKEFVLRFRTQLLSDYYAKHEREMQTISPEHKTTENIESPAVITPVVSESVELYSILGNSYKENSSYLVAVKNRGRTLEKKTKSVYNHFMNKKFIPFLKELGITTFSGITPPVIFKFQDYLLASGNTAETVNRHLGSVKAVFDYLLMQGSISENAFDKAKMLKAGGRKKAKTGRGCHEIDKLKGVFNAEWQNHLHYMLCLMIYSTGLRNCELERLQVKDILKLDEINFLNITKSKTPNGVRKVPLHPFVHEKLTAFAKNLGPDSYIFSANGNRNQSTLYEAANESLGVRLGMTNAQLTEKKITFYSGRHFWKTLMSGEGLGEDIEEYFMGHKVSGNVAQNYNHKDKQGKSKLLGKVREVFTILDKKLFVHRPKNKNNATCP